MAAYTPKKDGREPLVLDAHANLVVSLPAGGKSTHVTINRRREDSSPRQPKAPRTAARGGCCAPWHSSFMSSVRYLTLPRSAAFWHPTQLFGKPQVPSVWGDKGRGGRGGVRGLREGTVGKGPRSAGILLWVGRASAAPGSGSADPNPLGTGVGCSAAHAGSETVCRQQASRQHHSARSSVRGVADVCVNRSPQVLESPSAGVRVAGRADSPRCGSGRS